MCEYRITEDGLGDFEACPFCLALGIEDYDPDDFGGTFFPKDLTRLDILFHGAAFVPELQATWPTIPPSNCAVTLYNYKYTGNTRKFQIDGFRFLYLCCVEGY